MAFALVAKPTYTVSTDGAYTDGSADGAYTEPPQDGAYTDYGNGWSLVFTVWTYPVWTLASKSSDVSVEGGVPVEAGSLGVLITPGEVGVLDATSVWTRIEVPT